MGLLVEQLRERRLLRAEVRLRLAERRSDRLGPLAALHELDQLGNLLAGLRDALAALLDPRVEIVRLAGEDLRDRFADVLLALAAREPRVDLIQDPRARLCVHARQRRLSL